MEAIPVFPMPQRIEWTGEELALDECRVVLREGAPQLEALAASIVARAIAAAGAGEAPIGPAGEGSRNIYVGRAAQGLPAVCQALAELPDNPEAYCILVGAQGAALVGRGPAGTFYAAQTFRQLVVPGRASVPGLRIVDWPDFRYRGLYIESKWGPDLMSLEDWRELIDYMAGLKMNSLGVGVYCCWCVQYEGRRTEFLMVPFPDRPQLQTPKTIRYYSAKQGEWKALTYLPRMFAEDFFGEVVAYAKSRNVTVRPHFNGPGHTTLIPHVYPEVSAKDEAGRPTGYGYCLSNPRTYELLYSLWDSIIERYLRPHGVDWFHMGLDEIYPVRGVDEENPEAEVSPWCCCPDCRGRSPEELLSEYVLKAVGHLAAKGMNHITMWNDHLERSGMLTPAFVQALERAGVKEKVVLQWWRYNEPVLVPKAELGLRAWTTPMAGYWFWLFYEDLTANIYPHLQLAHRVGAEGADAYCTFDPAFDRNYHCLAEYAWNQSSSGDLYQFKSRYAQKLLGKAGFDAAEPFQKLDQAYGSIPVVRGLLDVLLYYWHTYSRAREIYPRNVLRALRRDELRAMATYRGVKANLERAKALFLAGRGQAPDAHLIDEYAFECERFLAAFGAYEAMIAAAEKAANAVEQADRQALQEAAGTLRQGLQRLDSMMALAEEVKRPYLLPQLLRDLSRLRGFMAELTAAIERGCACAGEFAELRALLAEIR